MQLKIHSTEDFNVCGTGSSREWDKADWQELVLVGGNPLAPYQTKIKVLYSKTGIYFLYYCEDKKLVNTMTKDFDDIYNEDVVELFFQPDQNQRLYFEYELSPLNVELPIMVPNDGKSQFFGWLPWHYEGARKIVHQTSAIGGRKESLASVKGWIAEMFIPFALFKGLLNCPPVKGTIWKGNLYRIDYDSDPARWAWCPDTGTNFHDYLRFGEWLFD